MFKRIIDRIREPLADHERGAFGKEKISIGVTTFEARYASYFVPLLDAIKDFEPDAEVIVAVNGEHELAFDEAYRKNILQSIAKKNKVYPILFPRFRGLSKLWNSIIIHATNDYVLMLNDDLTIANRHFLDDVTEGIRRYGGRSFLINNSWSYFLLSREEIDALGYFDERLLGIGEEDGDITWRYLNRYGVKVPSHKVKGILNHAEDSVTAYKPKNIVGHSGTKYSLFNREFMFQTKYRYDEKGIRGMFDRPASLKDPSVNQYPYESFYRHNKKCL